MVISQPLGITSYYYSCFTNAASIALNVSRDNFGVLYMQLQHQGNYRNGAIKHIFYTNQIHGGIIKIVLYSFCRSMRLLFI